MNGATQVLADEVFWSYTTEQLVDWARIPCNPFRWFAADVIGV